MADVKRMILEVLDDGTAKVTTEDMSGPLHLQADELMKEFAKGMGGEVARQKSPRRHRHRKVEQKQRR